MRRQLAIIGLTLLALIAIDMGVAAALATMDRPGRPQNSLVRYFEYGRSVPGKLARWAERPGEPENLFDVAWRDEMLAYSREAFAAEDASIPVVRSYGMSFVNQILDAAMAQDPTLRSDRHTGPGAPPNFTYAMFLDDRSNRRPGDVVVLGVLASSLPAMAALSNRSWAFEQPAPVTYPVFLPEDDGPGGDGLRRIDPVITSAAQQRAVMTDPAKSAAWQAQLAEVDLLRTPQAFALPALDVSPFLRQVRRALALSAIEWRKDAVLDLEGPYPMAETLDRMIRSFAAMARADEQIPVVMLIQDARGQRDLLAMARPALEATGVATLATAELVNPRAPRNSIADGHFTPQVNAGLGGAFLDLLARIRG